MNFNVSVPCFPTEDREKVENCLYNLFGEVEISEKEEKEKKFLLCEPKDASKLLKILEKEKIRKSFLEVLQSNYSNGKTKINLSKPAAFMGKARISEEFSLGHIELVIFCELDELERWIYG